jgi:hypothetical protein
LAGGAAWYAMQLRLQSEREQRESVAEALLVAYVPLSDDPEEPERLKTTMAELIAHVDAAGTSSDKARNLERLYVAAGQISAFAERSNSRRLRDFSIDYVQLKIDNAGLRTDEVARLVQTLKIAVGESCERGYVLPDDRAVKWFAKRGGVPAQCR